MRCLQDVDTGKVQERQYGSVIAACGHHWDPLWPELQGEFGGTMTHAHAYRSPKPFEGRRVLVIGGGNSGGGWPPQAVLAADVWQLALLWRHGQPCAPLSCQCDMHCVFSGRNK